MFVCVRVARGVNIGERVEEKRERKREMVQHYWKGHGVGTGSNALRVYLSVYVRVAFDKLKVTRFSPAVQWKGCKTEELTALFGWLLSRC